jgi:hypothetical protein
MIAERGCPQVYKAIREKRNAKLKMQNAKVR